MYYVYDILDMDFLIYIRQSLIHFEVSNDAFCWHVSATCMTEIKDGPFFVCVSQMTNKAFYYPSFMSISHAHKNNFLFAFLFSQSNRAAASRWKQGANYPHPPQKRDLDRIRGRNGKLLPSKDL